VSTTEDLLAEVAALRAELAALRAEVDARDGASRHPTNPPTTPPGPGPDRRQLLRMVAAGVGGLGVAQVAAAPPAAAANGQAFVLGSSANSASLPTGVAVTGNLAGYGLAATDNGANSVPLPSAVFGHARGWGGSTNFSTGVLGHAVEDAFYGVAGDSVRCGVYGIARGAATNGWPGVLGTGLNGVGVRGEGGTEGVVGRGGTAGVLGLGSSAATPALRAGGDSGLLSLDEAQAAPPSSGTYRRGDVLNDAGGSGLWVCVTGGTPGTWRKLAGRATAGAFHALTGVRAYSSRTTGGRLGAGQTRTITLPGAAAPAGTTAVSCVLTASATAGAGTLVLFPAHRTRPAITSLSWWAGSQQHSVGLTVAVSVARQVKVFASAGSTHLTLDVVGYYR
jgi:hypothetical protein